MLQKFKMTTYATLFLIGLFVLPYAGNIAEVSAEKYGCSWDSKKKLANCLKGVISERDTTIVEMQEKLDDADARLEKAGRLQEVGELLATSASKAAKRIENAILSCKIGYAEAGEGAAGFKGSDKFQSYGRTESGLALGICEADVQGNRGRC